MVNDENILGFQIATEKPSNDSNEGLIKYSDYKVTEKDIDEAYDAFCNIMKGRNPNFDMNFD